MYLGKKISVVIPAFNEQESIGIVVNDLRLLTNADQSRLIDDIVVCNNASTDDTAENARKAGARVVTENIPGYGNACLTALANIKSCDIILFVDGDDSCFAREAIQLIDSIARGNDLAIGSRALGEIEKGALAPAQVFGNKLSAWLIFLLWRYKITDLGPFRAISDRALRQIDMQDRRFGWTVEMQIKAIQLGLNIEEISVDSKVRIGKSKISGTLKGTIGAGIGILSKIAVLRFQQKELLARQSIRES